MLVGAIDIGTNSARYLLAEVGPELKVMRVETALKTTRLGEGIASGLLTEQAMARTAAAVAEFWRRAQSMGAQVITAVATSAVRGARNREEFLALVRQTTGLEVRVLSGDEEAFYTFAGVVTGLEVDREKTAVVDIGGGSTELIWIEKGRIILHSLPLGAVRLTEEGGGPAKAEALLGPFHRFLSGRRIIGTGGTITTLAAISQGIASYDPAKIHGYLLEPEEVAALTGKLAGLSLSDRKKVPGLQPERADIIVAGAGILTALFDLTGAPGITVSENDILYGVAFNTAGGVERKLAGKC
ncbi:MAG: Ppx/GppA family phosphatase [Bacillota bacterium]